MPGESSSYCAEQVRLGDNDRFLICLFAPERERLALFALHAFNLELARVPWRVTDSLVGLLRLQWWRESIERLYATDHAPGRMQGTASTSGGPLPHAVLDALAPAIRGFALSRHHFHALIDAREHDLADAPPADMAALQAHAEATAAPLMQLVMEVLGARDAAAHAVARRLGIGWTLTSGLRSVPRHLPHGRVMLPTDALRRHGGPPASLRQWPQSPAVSAAAAEVAAAAATHFDAAHRSRAALPEPARSWLLLSRLGRLYLAHLRKHGHRLFTPALQRPPAARHISLLWHHLTDRP